MATLLLNRKTAGVVTTRNVQIGSVPATAAEMLAEGRKTYTDGVTVWLAAEPVRVTHTLGDRWDVDATGFHYHGKFFQRYNAGDTVPVGFS